MSQQPDAQPLTLPRRFVGLDGLRGILALCVILVHVTGEFAPGILAKTHIEVFGQAIVTFFVLSGILIYWPFMNAILDGTPLPSLGRYARTRLFRVFPAYIVTFLVANFVLSAVFVNNAMKSIGEGTGVGTGMITEPWRVLAHLTLIQNYFPSQMQTGISASWTLTVELAYYFFLPFLCIGGAVLARRLGVRPVLAAAAPAILLIVVGVGTQFVLLAWFDAGTLPLLDTQWGATWQAILTRSIFAWSDNFGWGMLAGLAASLYYRRRGLNLGRFSLRTVAWVVTIASFVLATATFLLAPRFIGNVFAIFSTAFVLLIMIPRADGSPWRIARFLDNRVLVWLGTISLSIYLWHFPLLIVLDRLGWIGPDTWLGWAWNFALVLAVVVVVASISYRFIELPATRLFRKKKRTDARPPAPGETVGAPQSPSPAPTRTS